MAEGRAQWLTPVIPALWEAKGITQGQEFKISLANVAKPCLYQKYQLAGCGGTCL